MKAQSCLEIGEEGLGNSRKDQGTPRRECPDQRTHQNFYNFFDVDVGDGKSDPDSAKRVDESLA
jgi:hypothetical protein